VREHDVKKIKNKWRNAASPITLNTASGKITADHVAPIRCDKLDEDLLPYVLKSTPAVLSTGKRCIRMGYNSHWLEGKAPYFANPEGKILRLTVVGDKEESHHRRCGNVRVHGRSTVRGRLTGVIYGNMHTCNRNAWGGWVRIPWYTTCQGIPTNPTMPAYQSMPAYMADRKAGHNHIFA
jgi:hypothetical protein